jgi:hypothetical protein
MANTCQYMEFHIYSNLTALFNTWIFQRKMELVVCIGSGIVSGVWSYGSRDRIPPGYIVVTFFKKERWNDWPGSDVFVDLNGLVGAHVIEPQDLPRRVSTHGDGRQVEAAESSPDLKWILRFSIGRNLRTKRAHGQIHICISFLVLLYTYVFNLIHKMG